MNKVILMGRLTKTPEVRYAGANQTKIARFSIAVRRTRKQEGEPDADFIPLTTFGKLADFAEKYLTKGTKVMVTARVENNNYTDKDGREVYGFQFKAEEIEFCESKSHSSGGSSASPAGNSEGFMDIPDGIEEELPFN